METRKKKPGRKRAVARNFFRLLLRKLFKKFYEALFKRWKYYSSRLVCQWLKVIFTDRAKTARRTHGALQFLPIVVSHIL